jgi:hypothetical protein
MPGHEAHGAWKPQQGQQVPHEQGFRHALEAALQQTGWPAGDYEDVTVEHTAKVSITNPGNILEYRVKLTG